MTLRHTHIGFQAMTTIIATTIALLLASPGLAKDANPNEDLNALKKEREFLRIHHIGPTKLAVENLDWMLSQDIYFVTPALPGHKMSGIVPVPKEYIEKALTVLEVDGALAAGKMPDMKKVAVAMAEYKTNDLIIREVMRNKLVHLKETYAKQVKDLNRLNYEIEQMEEREASTTKAPPAIVDLSGKWNTSFFVQNKMVTYTITQEEDDFSWQISGTGLAEVTRNGKIKGNSVSIEYKRTAGQGKTSGYVPVSGTVSTKPGTNKAIKIVWQNGVVWTKAP
jgi:hypothetical protein